jgi:thiosulfate reductase cytochrome b subunit
MIITANWFVDITPLKDLTNTILNFNTVMVAFMMGFAGVNLLVIHTRRIQRNMSQGNMFDAAISVVLLGCLIIWTAVGIFTGRSNATYQWLYSNFNLPLSSTAYAATLFYLASATYRVIRVRSTETTILVVVSIVVIMGNMPMFVTYIPALLTVKSWIADVVVTAAYRAITIGVGLGGILMGVRTLLAMETGFLGATED